MDRLFLLKTNNEDVRTRLDEMFAYAQQNRNAPCEIIGMMFMPHHWEHTFHTKFRAVYNHWTGLDWTGLKNLMNDLSSSRGGAFPLLRSWLPNAVASSSSA